MKIVLILLFALLSNSCKKASAKEEILTAKNTKNVVEKDSLKMIDTTIVLTNIQSSIDCAEITEMEAEKFLYKYFKSKGALPRNQIKDYSRFRLTYYLDFMNFKYINLKVNIKYKYTN